MTKYRKTEPVEAIEFDFKRWINDKSEYPMVSDKFDLFGSSKGFLEKNNRPFILGLEGIMNISDGDLIIKGVRKGEFYPCKPDIFELTYELAE